MLEVRKAAISLDEAEVLELERIVVDGDEKEALAFLKRCVYDRILHGQQGRLKSHLDGVSDPAKKFVADSK